MCKLPFLPEDNNKKYLLKASFVSCGYNFLFASSCPYRQSYSFVRIHLREYVNTRDYVFVFTLNSQSLSVAFMHVHACVFHVASKESRSINSTMPIGSKR